jgi:hypothetical protein
VIPNSRKDGVNPALFKSLYQDDKKILPGQVNGVEERNGQSQAELDVYKVSCEE